MLRTTIFASLLASSAISLAIASPAAAGTTENARDAIARAEAKIHTAENLGAATEAPRDLSDARAALMTAKHDFDTDRRKEAIDVAIQASAMADTAIGVSQQHKNADVAQAREAQQATRAAAREAVADARNEAAQTSAQAQSQVIAAQQQAAQAQQQAADANARADRAEDAAASSAADAAAARNAAAIAAQTPPAPQVETTVTTQHGATRPRAATKTVVTKRTTTAPAATTSSSSDQVTTTTKVIPN